MIREILLHIGVHKTASTTIQNTLYAERLKLSEAGVLYPQFKAGSIDISNHSIPFYSLFCKNPEKYHFNLGNGFTSSEVIQTLHHAYRRQLQEQTATFEGEILIISGEDISFLETDEIENLKTFLLGLTHPDVHFRVVMMCRHPVSRFRSALQATVCAFGLPIQNATGRNMQRTHLYQNIFSNFSSVFGRQQLSLIKYEDTISHHFGPTGVLLALADKDLPDKIKPAVLHENQTRKYETFVLLNAVNEACYHTSGEELQPERMVELNRQLMDIPGQKFMLPKGLSLKAWQKLAEDVNWICREFSLQPYIFSDEDMQETSDIWSDETLEHLKSVFPDFSDFHKRIFLDALLKEMRDKRKIFTFNKAQKIFELVLFYSKYLQVGSRIAKFRYFSRVVGFTKTLRFSLHHITH